MKVREIIKDSLKYPFTDWKKFLILGIILVISDVAYISTSFGKNTYLLVLLIGIAFVVGLLVNGYIFRIINSAFDDKFELPEFSNWVDMGVEGAKVYLVYIVYLIPVILLIILLSLGPLSNFGISTYVSAYDFIGAFNSVLWQGIGNFISLLFLFGIVTQGYGDTLGILYYIGILYPFIITPILLVAVANMVLDDGDLKSAFKIREILEEISVIGWGNLIKWYILTGIILIILNTIITIVLSIFNLINHLLGILIILLIIYPYISIFLARSLALFYIPEED